MVELYHILNRGVDKRVIFQDSADYARFVHDLYEFNDSRPANNNARIFSSNRMNDFVSRSLKDDREQIVYIHGWCLMRNHYHLLVSERAPENLTKFIRKLNIGYAKYFNERHRRIGTLFQGRTKKVLIDTDAHFLHILHYIHLNPLDYLEGAKLWRERKLTSSREAMQYLSTYRWSSYLDYCGNRNFPSILTKDFFEEALGNIKNETERYLKDVAIESMDFDFLE